jgi:transposase
MDNVIIIGIDLAKRVFHAHGAHADGSVAFRKRMARSQVLPLLARQPTCVVAMEACASAHEWGRAIRELGHEVRQPKLRYCTAQRGGRQQGVPAYATIRARRSAEP